MARAEVVDGQSHPQSRKPRSVAMVERASSITALLVIYKPRSEGCSAIFCNASATSSTSFGRWSCFPERLTHTVGLGLLGYRSYHALACR